jgi:hypothetical protein
MSTSVVGDPKKPYLRLAFRARSYDELAREDLHRRFDDVATVELIPQRLPEAGADAEVVAAIRFVGSSIASGVIGAVAYDALKEVCRRLAHWWRLRAETEIIVPQFIQVEMEFDNISVVFVDERHSFSPDIFFLNDRQLERLPELCEQVVRTLPDEFLFRKRISRIEVPVSQMVGEDVYGAEMSRFWELESSDGQQYLYDSWRGVVGEKPTEEIRPFLDLGP